VHGPERRERDLDFPLVLQSPVRRAKVLWELQSVASYMYAAGWISGVVGGIYRALLYSGKIGVVGHILPYNLLQLCAIVFLIAIASDARVIAATRSR